MAEKLTKEEKVKKVRQGLSECIQVRQPWETLWQDAFDLTLPRRMPFSFPLDQSQEGQKTGMKKYDGTAGTAAQIHADGLQGYTISAAFPWFRLGIPYSAPNIQQANRLKWIERIDSIPEVKDWLVAKEDVLYAGFRRSNIYDEICPFFLDGVVANTAYLYAEEDLRKGRTVFSCRHPGECYIRENMFGQVDTIYRIFQMSVKQIGEKFADGDLPQDIKNKLLKKEGLGDLQKVIHVVLPKEDLYGKESYPWDWVSLYMLDSGSNILSESGYPYFPFITWRYRKNSFETYGRGPGLDTVVDNLGLQQVSKDLLQAAHNSVFGIWSAPEEMRGEVRITAMGINYYRDQGREVKAINQNINFPIGVDREQRMIKNIEENFKVDFFMMLARAERQMTAYEIAERSGEKAVLAGPILGRLNSEVFNPLIDIMDFIETRAGRMPPPPDVLLELAGGKNIEVDYIGPLSEAQKRLFAMRGITQTLQMVAQAMQIDPTSADNIDMDQIVQETGKANNSSSKILRSPEKVAEIRQARAEAQQAEKMAMMAAEAAKVAPGLAKAPEPGSPMEQMQNSMAGGEKEAMGA